MNDYNKPPVSESTRNMRWLMAIIVALAVALLVLVAVVGFANGSTMRPVAFAPAVMNGKVTALDTTGVVTPEAK